MSPTKPADAAKSAEHLANMFEISRHMAHSVETTQVAAEVVERMKLECEILQGPNVSLGHLQRLKFLHSMLRGLFARSISNEKRLASEQTLVSLAPHERPAFIGQS